MPSTFIDLAQTCAPNVAVEILAGVVSLESEFAPLAIRVNSGAPLSRQPTTKAEAIEIASIRALEKQDIQLGLGGIGVEELRKLKLSISDAFDPCLNLQATAYLLDGYYRLAVKAGADAERAERVMLQSYYGRDDASIGAMVKYDEQVRQEIKRLSENLAALTIGVGGQRRRPTALASADGVVEDPKGERSTDRSASVPIWDVFNSRGRSSVLLFQNNQPEQSE